MTYARSSPDLKDCLLGRITTPTASVSVCVHALSQSVPRVAVKNIHNVSRLCPSACTRRLLLSHWVSLIKTGRYASAFRDRDGL